MGDAEINGLVDGVGDLLQIGEEEFAQPHVVVDDVAELEQLDAQIVFAGLLVLL